VTNEGDRRSVYYRDPGGETWRLLAEFDMNVGFRPHMIGPDNTLYVAARTNKHELICLPAA